MTAFPPLSDHSLEEQVAQCFMVGYSGTSPGEVTRRFLAQGVGGLIFFRDNFDTDLLLRMAKKHSVKSFQKNASSLFRPYRKALSEYANAYESLEPSRAVPPHAAWVADLLRTLADAVPVRLPRPLLGIDQEGGRVERLPHWLFPNLPSPRAVALAPHPQALAREVYGLMAEGLRSLGFNLNFFPTLDVNLEPRNPIIGVRSFGNDPETVWRLSEIALQSFEQHRLIAVGKHFPGHGHGMVDSHLDLPVLHFSEAELTPFRQAIAAGLPMMLAAHGFYPALQTSPQEQDLLSSASPAILQGLLRERCGFQGVIITDDLCMGAVTRYRDPVGAALAAIRAGADILLYKQSTPVEWTVYEAVIHAYRTGELPIARLHESLVRIAALKARYLDSSHARRPKSLSDPQGMAERIAVESIGVLSGDPACLPLRAEERIWLVYPERRGIEAYAFDVPTSPDWPELLRVAGFRQAKCLAYPAQAPFSTDALLAKHPTDQSSPPDSIVFVTFNPLLYPDQVPLYRRLAALFPQARRILACVGMPERQEVGGEPLPASDLSLSLCSYRPSVMRALLRALTNGARR